MCAHVVNLSCLLPFLLHLPAKYQQRGEHMFLQVHEAGLLIAGISVTFSDRWSGSFFHSVTAVTSTAQ